jgi:hypothetical protein
MSSTRITSAPNYHGAPPASIPSFLFSPEIETALIGLLWREPDRISIVKRELDPALHFVQPHCRWLLEAIDLAYRELATVDFACVIEVLRELGRLEDVGGLEGANELWNAGEFLNSPVWQAMGKTDALFAEYLRMIKQYAVNRGEQPPRPTYLFIGGKGTLLLDKARVKADHYTGEVSVAGRWYSVRAEVGSEGEFINLRFEPKR